MIIHFDKQTVKKDLIEKYAKNLDGIIEEGELFYSIILPFGYKEYTLSDAKNQ